VKDPKDKGLGYSLMAECLPSMLEVPGSIPSTAKKKKKDPKDKHIHKNKHDNIQTHM
jgi:hypothetical protein